MTIDGIGIVWINADAAEGPVKETVADGATLQAVVLDRIIANITCPNAFNDEIVAVPRDTNGIPGVRNAPVADDGTGCVFGPDGSGVAHGVNRRPITRLVDVAYDCTTFDNHIGRAVYQHWVSVAVAVTGIIVQYPSRSAGVDDGSSSESGDPIGGVSIVLSEGNRAHVPVPSIVILLILEAAKAARLSNCQSGALTLRQLSALAISF